MVLLDDVQKIVVLPQIQYIAVCHGKTNSLNLECSETVEDDLQNAVQRWSGQCPCRDAEAFSHLSTKKKLDGINSFLDVLEIPCVS